MNPQFLLGFSEHQILQVVANAFKMFTLDDVCCYVEIWNMNHAFKILDILSQVFGDMCEIDENFFNDQIKSNQITLFIHGFLISIST